MILSLMDQVEQHLVASGLSYTILRPVAFMVCTKPNCSHYLLWQNLFVDYADLNRIMYQQVRASRAS